MGVDENCSHHRYGGQGCGDVDGHSIDRAPLDLGLPSLYLRIWAVGFGQWIDASSGAILIVSENANAKEGSCVFYDDDVLPVEIEMSGLVETMIE